MKVNEKLRTQILKAVETQLKENKPPETKQTYKRLLAEGITKENAKIYIAQCLSTEIYTIMKYKKPFDEKRYARNLQNLPNEPKGGDEE